MGSALVQVCQRKAARDDEGSTYNKSRNVSRRKIPLTFYLKQKTVLFTAFAFFAYNYILFFFLTWFPSYLVDERGLSVESMSVITVIPWILGFIGLAAGGFVSDYVYKKRPEKVCCSRARLCLSRVCFHQLS